MLDYPEKKIANDKHSSLFGHIVCEGFMTLAPDGTNLKQNSFLKLTIFFLLQLTCYCSHCALDEKQILEGAEPLDLNYTCPTDICPLENSYAYADILAKVT
jgi:hypothetical protein